MGPWLALVSPCFRENVVTICKFFFVFVFVFFCNSDNLLQKNVIVFCCGN